MEFSVREPDSERFVTFSDDVDLDKVKDWFERVSLGVQQLFDTATAPVSIILRHDNHQRIMAIKMVREITMCGLKEAKEAVEDSMKLGHPMIICEDGRDAPSVMQKFDDALMRVIKGEHAQSPGAVNTVKMKPTRSRSFP